MISLVDVVGWCRWLVSLIDDVRVGWCRRGYRRCPLVRLRPPALPRSGRIVASEVDATNTLANPVQIGRGVVQGDSANESHPALARERSIGSLGVVVRRVVEWVLGHCQE